VSGHSSTSGAASTVLAALLPERAAELEALAEQAAASRLYGGIHFASDNEAGLALGRRVGHVAVKAYHLRHDDD
jgi:membrane-associated phospholipid phosphatase